MPSPKSVIEVCARCRRTIAEFDAETVLAGEAVLAGPLCTDCGKR